MRDKINLFIKRGHKAIEGLSSYNSVFSIFVNQLGLSYEGRIGKSLPLPGNHEFVGFKDPNRCKLELTLLADMHNFLKNSPSFGALIDSWSNGGFYVAKHSEDIRPLDYFEWADLIDDIPEENGEECKEPNVSKIVKYCEILKGAGYEVNLREGYKLFGVLNNSLLSEYFLTTANIEAFDNKKEILAGLNGEGRLGRLDKIYQNLPVLKLEKV